MIFEESLLQARGPQLNVCLVDGPIVVFDLVLLSVDGVQLMKLVSRRRVDLLRARTEAWHLGSQIFVVTTWEPDRLIIIFLGVLIFPALARIAVVFLSTVTSWPETWIFLAPPPCLAAEA